MNMKKHNKKWALATASMVNKSLDATIYNLEDLIDYAKKLDDQALVKMINKTLTLVEDGRDYFENWVYDRNSL